MHQYKKVTLDYLQTAPQTIKFTMELPVSSKQLFHIFEQRNTWQWAGIEDVIWDSEPPYNAATKRTIVQPSGAKLDEQFLVWEQDRRMVFRIDQADINIFGALLEDYTVEPLGDATCQFTWTIAYELRDWRAVFTPVLKFVIHQAFKGMVKDFKEMVQLRSQSQVPEPTYGN